MSPEMNSQKLFDFIAEMHKKHVRKYTNEPYINHLVAVAEMADGKCNFGYEIGLCHDLLEDTECTVEHLENALLSFGYGVDTVYIVDAVIELTDIYTPEAYPNSKRAVRKRFEAYRLAGISYKAQTVKYCDLIDNTSSIVKHDNKFAKVYLAEKKMILSGMNKGNPEMYQRALNSVLAADALIYELNKGK